jgi:nitrous oxide reductase accessory protein NosL
MAAAVFRPGVQRHVRRIRRWVDRRAFLKLVLFATLCAPGVSEISGLCRAARASGPIAAVHPLGPGLKLNIGADDRCPVCGMRPSRYPKFSCAIRLHDGRTFYFCSAGCMLRSWIHPLVFLSVSAGDMELAVVREYFSGAAMDARMVTWVAGSDVIGPMGPAVVALAGERHLAAFRRRHGGKHLFRLDDLTDGLWQKITGQTATR